MSRATRSILGGWFYTRLSIGAGFGVFILWGCVTPNPPSMGWPEFDKVEYAGSMAWLALWFGLMFYRHLTQVALWVALYGGVIEVVQTYLVTRDGNLFYFGADSAGALIGAGAALVLLKAWQKRGGSLREAKLEQVTESEKATASENPFEDSAHLELTDRELHPKWNSFEVQQDLISDEGEILARLAEKRVDSMVLCGPSSSGKSKLAQHMADSLGWRYLEIDGRSAGIGGIREAFDQAVEARRKGWDGVTLFVDAIDQLSIVARDALLICAQDGALVFIGSATSAALAEDDTLPLSRVRRFTVHSN